MKITVNSTKINDLEISYHFILRTSGPVDNSKL